MLNGNLSNWIKSVADLSCTQVFADNVVEKILTTPTVADLKLSIRKHHKLELTKNLCPRGMQYEAASNEACFASTVISVTSGCFILHSNIANLAMAQFYSHKCSKMPANARFSTITGPQP